MSTIKVDTVQSTGGNDVTLTKQSASKGWLSYDADTSNSIDNSFNLSSITDNGTGTYARTLTNALANDDYSTGGSQQLSQSNYAISTFTTTTHAMFVRNDAGTFSDASHVSVQNFGDLA